MNAPARPILVLLGLSVLPALGLASPAAGQTASLVKDIRPRANYRIGFNPDQMWTLQGKVLFAATEPSSGRELWITDGNGSGTRMLADLFPGENSSNPLVLGTARSLLFGIAFHDASCCSRSSQSYLWRSDGTREGTLLLPDPLFRVALPFDDETREGPPVPIAFTADGAYFTGCIEQEGCGLWRTDGTPAGTRMLRQIGGSAFGGGPTELTLAGSRLFFATYQQLWTSDGTPDGTTLVREFKNASPRRLAALGNKLLFLAPAAAPGSGEELWVSDGTAAGTGALTSFEAERPFQQTNFLKALGDRIYFVADDATHGAEIWASNGTPKGTLRITDFGFHDPFNGADFGDGLFSWEIDKLGDRLIFWATDGLTGFKLWSTRGTLQSTAAVCSTCSFGYAFVRFVKLNGKLVFHANDGFHGDEVWTTDGTAAGTKLLKDACPGFCSGAGSDLTLLPGAVYFRGPGDLSYTQALWTSDGTAQGTRLFAAAEVFASGPPPAAALGNRVLFSAEPPGDVPDFQQELWVSDGTPGGTRQVSDLGQSGASADVAELVSAGDRVFFTAFEENDYNRYVWRSAGAAADTLKSPEPSFDDLGDQSRLFTAGGKAFLLLADYHGDQLWRVGDDGQTVQLTHLAEHLHIFYPVSYQGLLYFVVSQQRDYSTAELWRSNGTAEGTARAVDLPDLRGVGFLKVLGPELWFLAHDSSDGAEIWRTDGTQAGTLQVYDFGFSRSRQDPEFTKIGSAVYFVALRGDNGDDFDYQIWKTDGTSGGTALLTDFPGLNSTRAMPAELTSLGGNLYFFASLPTTGRALWRSDGTSLGTLRVRDFPLPRPSLFEIPSYGLNTLGDLLIFAIDDGVHGREPWRCDGTAEGTVLLRDVNPGRSGSEVTEFREAAGRLFFSATDGAHGFELWRTDGTAAGTRLVQDIAPEGASSYPAGFTVAGGRLFFGADDGVTGNELWALPLSGPACQPSATALCLNGGRFKVEASWRNAAGDPARGQAVALTSNSGYFRFASPTNVQAILKVVDGRGANGHFWVSYGALSGAEYSLTVTDTQTGLARRYFNPRGQFASVGDTLAFGPLGAHETKAQAPAATPLLASERLDVRAATGTCVPAAGLLCLNGGRFAVKISWKDSSNRKGSGKAVPITGDTGYFWFLDAANVEIVLKVQNATAVNGHFWVYYGALSNVEYTLTVTDTLTGKVKTYKNPQGRFASGVDMAAF